MGANKLMVLPGPGVQRRRQLRRRAERSTLTPEDAEAIRRECPAVKAVAPIVRERAHGQLQGKNYCVQTHQGTTPSSSTSATGPLADGEPFTDRDVRSARQVCLIGQTIVRELFGDESPSARRSASTTSSFKVLGVLSRKGANMMGLDQDDIVLAPWTTIKYRIDVPVERRQRRRQRRRPSAAVGPAPSTINTLSRSTPPARCSSTPASSPRSRRNTPMLVRFANIDQIIAAADLRRTTSTTPSTRSPRCSASGTASGPGSPTTSPSAT